MTIPRMNLEYDFENGVLGYTKTDLLYLIFDAYMEMRAENMGCPWCLGGHLSMKKTHHDEYCPFPGLLEATEFEIEEEGISPQ